ncbi:MAG: hypothetical protein ACI4RA_05550 [Kiritimatiellia bacterium]
MTVAENGAIAPRADAAFAFAVDGTRFFPQAGARLSFASRTAATLHLPGLPQGLVAPGAEVTATFNGETVFRGTAERIVTRRRRGLVVEDVTCRDAWDLLERRVYRQAWRVAAADGTAVETSTARVVLNVDADGLPIPLAEQVTEICSAGGLMASDGGIPAATLPADEARDVTCADAIRRALRLFPQVVAAYDAAYDAVAFRVPAAGDAAYMAGPLLSRATTRTAHPVVGVDIATESVDTSVVSPETGLAVASRAVTHQTAGDVASDDCLHVYLPLAGGASSTSWESLVVETEEMPALQNAPFWQRKHHRLANVPASAITITEAGRSSTKYDKITSNDVGALRAFGLNAEVVHCHCKATVKTADDVEEELYLTMDFAMTDASPGRHTRQTGSSSTAAETLPEGLAAAILAQRGGAVEAEDVSIVVGEAFPRIGDSFGGLVLQSFDVDCATLVANLHFGHPDYLTPEDMRDLLNGFRARGSAANVPHRAESDLGADATPVAGGVMPLTTTEFCPGVKAKTTVKSSSGGGSIVLDAAAVGAGKSLAVRELTYTPSGGSATTLKVLAEDDVELPPGGGGGAEHAAEPDTNATFTERDGKIVVGVYYL